MVVDHLRLVPACDSEAHRGNHMVKILFTHQFLFGQSLSTFIWIDTTPTQLARFSPSANHPPWMPTTRCSEVSTANSTAKATLSSWSARRARKANPISSSVPPPCAALRVYGNRCCLALGRDEAHLRLMCHRRAFPEDKPSPLASISSIPHVQIVNRCAFSLISNSFAAAVKYI